jgi:hypothetical protein
MGGLKFAGGIKGGDRGATKLTGSGKRRTGERLQDIISDVSVEILVTKSVRSHCPTIHA